MEGNVKSLFSWLYIDNLTYKYGMYKHILTKGHSGFGGMCPGMYIHSKQNDIIVLITTKKGGLEELIINDFPIR